MTYIYDIFLDWIGYFEFRPADHPTTKIWEIQMIGSEHPDWTSSNECSRNHDMIWAILSIFGGPD